MEKEFAKLFYFWIYCKIKLLSLECCKSSMLSSLLLLRSEWRLLCKDQFLLNSVVQKSTELKFSFNSSSSNWVFFLFFWYISNREDACFLQLFSAFFFSCTVQFQFFSVFRTKKNAIFQINHLNIDSSPELRHKRPLSIPCRMWLTTCDRALPYRMSVCRYSISSGNNLNKGTLRTQPITVCIA